MAEMLLINPRKRRGARKVSHTAKRRVSRKANPYASMLTNARRRKHSARKTNPPDSNQHEM